MHGRRLESQGACKRQRIAPTQRPFQQRLHGSAWIARPYRSPFEMFRSPGPEGSDTSLSSRRHTLVGQLLECLGALAELGEAHAAQHMGRLAELNVLVSHDLDAIAPGIEEIEKAPRQRLYPGGGQRLAHRLLVVDHE